MTISTNGYTVKVTANDKGNPPGKLADIELHFEEGPLAGLKLTGFGLWERRSGTGRNVTFPARHERCLKAGKDLPLWVFPSREHMPLEERNLRHVFTRLLEKAGLAQVRIHDLRHTYASLLLQQGESVVYVKEQLGHASIQITVDTYGHLIPGANRGAVERLDDGVLQPSATQAQPQPCADDPTLREMQELFGKSGEPNVRWLEHHQRLAGSTRLEMLRAASSQPGVRTTYFAETARIRGDSLNARGRPVQFFTVDVLGWDTRM